MAPSRKYTAGAFRKALEERLKTISRNDQIDLNRLRRHVSFDRLLARLFRAEAPPWVLKGGYALELRFKSARSTAELVAPPLEWQMPFQTLAEACGLPPDIAIVFAKVREFLKRALDSQEASGSHDNMDT
jgi:hypothetical protein